MFCINYKVTIKDINYGGHMGNEIPLLIFQQARIEFLESGNMSELDIGDGIGIIQRESFIKYNKEAFLGEILQVCIKKITIERVSIAIEYEITNSFLESVAEGKTVMLAYNYAAKKVSKIPEKFKELAQKI